MSEPKRIERRVMNGGGPVVLVVELYWPFQPDDTPDVRYFVDGVCVYPDAFDRVTRMLALPLGSAL